VVFVDSLAAGRIPQGQNYRRAEELSQLNAGPCRKNLQGSGGGADVRRESTNAQRFSVNSRCLPQGGGRHDFIYDSSISAFWNGCSLDGGPWAVAGSRWLGWLPNGGDGVGTLTTFICSPSGCLIAAPVGGTLHPDQGGLTRPVERIGELSKND